MPWMVAILDWDADRKNLREALSRSLSIYSPKIRELVVENRRRVWREEFLFGRYSFVEMVGSWRDAFRLRGIREILTDAKKNPAVARDEEVMRFKHMEDSDGFVVLPDAFRPRKLRRGDACRITEGPFADELAVYSGMVRRDRELALVNFLGRKVRVEVAAGTLVPA